MGCGTRTVCRLATVVKIFFGFPVAPGRQSRFISMYPDLASNEALLSVLHKRWAEQPLNEAEEQLLADWLNRSEYNRLAFRELMDEEWLQEQLKGWNRARRETIWQQSRQAASIKPVRRVHFMRKAWLKYAAAIIILFGIGAYLWNTQQKDTPATAKTTLPVPAKNDVAPGFSRAILTLSDGRRIELNNASSDTIHDGTLSIKNNDGQLNYLESRPSRFEKERTDGGGPSPFEKGGAAKRRGISFNTMSTPNGGQYQLTLSDGTKVWLNAASNITYPTAFNGKTRQVTVTGEVYFEVAKYKEKPFIVKTRKDDITVLGTSFNVQAYADEDAGKISLAEGSVKINDKILQPGQAYVNGKIIKTDLSQDIAWKTGYFNFEDKNLRQVMREISRWYDLQIVYDGGIKEMRFGGEVPRNLTLAQLLKTMEGAGINFQLEGNKTLRVKP
jgi:ferric-dicitrate binding protein FerR (iron transport regulator)